MFKETKKRTLTKTITWRVVAILNSYLILLAALSADPLQNALLMNLTGFVVFYIFERIWNKITWGRIQV